MGCWHSKLRELQQSIFRSNSHPSLSKQNVEIDQKQDSSQALEVLPKQLQAAKNQPIVSLRERIEELTRENGRLRQEVAFYQSIWNAMMSVPEETESMVVNVQQTLHNFHRVQTEAETEWLDFWKLDN